MQNDKTRTVDISLNEIKPLYKKGFRACEEYVIKRLEGAGLLDHYLTNLSKLHSQLIPSEYCMRYWVE